MHLGGILIVDRDLTPLAQADLDQWDSYSTWLDILQKPSLQDMLRYPAKTYVGKATLLDTPYDFAAAATDDGSKLILCYSSTIKPSTDPYDITLRNVLINNSFYKKPSVVITDGTQILSANDPAVTELSSGQYQMLRESVNWQDDHLVRFRYDHTTFYGLRRVYGDYYLYAVYRSREVFSDRTTFIILAFMVYLLLCMYYLLVQRRVDRLTLEQTQKQLCIINAISTSYSSTFLLHLDRPELEAVHPSARMQALFAQHPDPYDFLVNVCQQYVAPEHCSLVLDFLELHSLADRLKGKPYLGNEVRDIDGVWYSIGLIPQRVDAEGNVQAVLVTTQDVTSIKQAEELSFTDKLTGLRNRNYMEARGESFMQAAEPPVTLIMADCNYLKRTNDTLGHEYGDLLLQRVARSIRECLPEESIAMRVGGDEFLILCARCPAEKAARLVADIRQRLAVYSEDTLPLSVSFGVYTAKTSAVSFRDAYDAADQAMYEEKQRTHLARS